MDAFLLLQIKPLYSTYQKDLSNSLWEPLNTFWAECYESCKFSSQRRAKLQMESRRKFQVSDYALWNDVVCSYVVFDDDWFLPSLLHQFIFMHLIILQEKILIPCRIRQSEELARINVQQTQRKAKDAHIDRRWLILKRFLYGPKGAWAKLWVVLSLQLLNVFAGALIG